MTDPSTDAEWQEAAEAARMVLLLDKGREYGLFAGGLVVSVDRCNVVLKRAEQAAQAPAEPEPKEPEPAPAG